MAGNYMATILKLQKALNTDGDRILFSRSQFYSVEQNRAITMFIISRAAVDAETRKTKNIELFKSARLVYCLFFIRNLWFLRKGRDIPKSNIESFDKIWDEYLESNLE